MGTTKTIEKNASAEMFSPSVSPSAARDAEVKKSVEMASQDFTPKNRIADPVIEGEAVAEPQPIAEAKTVDEEPPTIQRRVSSKQRKLSLEEYRNTFMRPYKIEDRKPVFISGKLRKMLDKFACKIGEDRMSMSGLLENIVRHHIELYSEDFEHWKGM